MRAQKSQTGERSTTNFGLTAASTTERRTSSRRHSRRRAMEKTQATPAWKTPLAFPTLPQLRLRDKFVGPPARILGAVHLHTGCRMGGEPVHSPKVHVSNGHSALF